MKFSTKACIVAAIAAAFTFAGPSAFAAEKDDPCPGQHIQVYTANNNSVSPHYVCGTGGSKGEKGDTGPAGPQGPAGEDGADGKDGADGVSDVAGPQGPIGLTGPKGDTGADSTVAGPKGDKGDTGDVGATGAVGPIGDTGAVGPVGDRGPAGTAGVQGEVGKDGKNGVTKTVYITRVIAEDGTVIEEIPVDSLPETGTDGWILGLVGLGLIAAGIGAVSFYRNRN